MHGWQANKKGTCALPVEFRAICPKMQNHPHMRVDIFLVINSFFWYTNFMSD